MQKIFSITAATILTLSLSACMPSTPATSDISDASVTASSSTWDDCPGIDAYENLAFYNSMVTSLKINATPALLPPPEDEEKSGTHYIVGACYSEKLNTTLVLTNTTFQMGGAEFGIFEYDARTNTVTTAVHELGLPYPSILGEFHGTKLDLIDTVCVAPDSDGPGECPENSATFQYDLESHKIVDKAA